MIQTEILLEHILTLQELGIHNNPVADLYRSKDDYNKNLRVIAEGFLNWNITPELEFKSSAGIQMRDFNGRYFLQLKPRAW